MITPPPKCGVNHPQTPHRTRFVFPSKQIPPPAIRGESKETFHCCEQLEKVENLLSHNFSIWRKVGGNDRRTEGRGVSGRRRREGVLWGRIWIRLSSGDPSSSRINALKFFVFPLNGFKETAGALLRPLQAALAQRPEAFWK